MEIKCVSKRGWSFNEYSISAQVTQLFENGEVSEKSQPFSGSLRRNGKQLKFTFYVRQNTTYILTFFGSNMEIPFGPVGERLGNELLEIPIRYDVK